MDPDVLRVAEQVILNYMDEHGDEIEPERYTKLQALTVTLDREAEAHEDRKAE